MRKSFIIIALTAVYIICSCEKEIKFNGKYDGHKIVLFSSANTEDFLSARIYQTAFILDRDEYNLRDSILSGAKLVAGVNGKEYPMVEVKGEGYFSNYIPKVGDDIRITASVNGFDDVWGETIVPEEPQFSVVKGAIDIKKEEDFQAGTLHFKVTINDPAGVNNYYSIKFFAKYADDDYSYIDDVGSKDALFYKVDEVEEITGGGHDYSIPSVFDDGGFAGSSHTFDIYTEMISYRQYEWDPETETYVPGDLVPMEDVIANYEFMVEVQSWSESLYRYSVSYETADNSSDITEVFGEPVKISCNIEGGIGCVGAISSRRINVQQ